MASTVVSHQVDTKEMIEWDLPINEIEASPEMMDLSKLSIGTELQNKMWENDNKAMLNSTYHASNSSSPSLDQNQNLQNITLPHFMSNYVNGHVKPVKQNTSAGNGYIAPSFSDSAFSRYQPQQYSLHQNGTQNQQLTNKSRARSQPLLQSPVPMPDERKTPELLSSDNGVFDDRRMQESQTIKEELLEMKSIFTKLAAQTEDIVGLPEPVQIALKVIKLEGSLQDCDYKIKEQEETIKSLNDSTVRMKKEHEFQLEQQKKEVQFLTEKLAYKTNLDAKMKSLKQKDEKNEGQEIAQLKEELEDLRETKDQKIKELEDANSSNEHRIKMLEFEVSNNEKELKCFKDKLSEQETNQQNKKTDLEKYITAAREAMERERKDRYLLLVEQNKLKHKVEKLSETCKSYQLKNEELCRIQNELEQECDQFRKLKKMIQEHGLPNHEQLIMLQQQTEMFKDDVLSERKDRERAQAQREKLRRDLEIMQSRNQSLQEQVYKYQEHIMRLNTGDRRYQSHQEFITAQQNSGKFGRQFSSPAYYNPKIRASPTNVSNQIKAAQFNNGTSMTQGTNRQNSPVGEMSTGRSMNNGYQNNYQSRGNGGMRHPPGYGGGNQYDPWQQKSSMQQQQQQQQIQQRNNFNSYNNFNRAPRSPLLGPNGDPWVVPASPNSPTQPPSPMGQVNSGLNYNSNIWSQHSPTSPASYSNSSMRSNVQVNLTSSWQYSGGDNASTFTSQADSASSLKTLTGESWSTAVEDAHASGDQQLQMPPGNDYPSVDNQQEPNSSENMAAVHGIGGFQCGKCNTKFQDTESFRGHAEKCFN